jgi:transposase
LTNETSQSEFEALLAALLRGEMTEAQSGLLAALGVEAVRLALMAANARVAELQSASVAASMDSASMPPASVPIYLKPKTSGRKKKPGAKVGHKGSRRKTPVTIDEKVEHRLEVCPCCAGPLQRCERVRTRVIEDIPRQITPVVTEHTIHRDYCPSCKKHVEPVVPDAMPNATLGHHVVALGSWFHYGLGVTISQVKEILCSHLNTEITAGGLVDGWRRLAEALLPWYEQIGQEARASAVLHADETGWRVLGQTWWLWCFCTLRCCYYLIDPSRGSSALQKFFVDAFEGTLVSDFWAAYNQGVAKK